jgi:translation initiation factor IF-2
MRQRGANVTDIVVLVVAADDGIMPQTIEAINHTRAAGVPMIVAINKVDKPEANPQKIRERLLEHSVVVEAMSGDVQDVEVSAKTGAGLDQLVEAIHLQAELLDLKARPDREAEGIVVEAQLDKGRGAVATLLVTRGTLKRGDTFVVGTQSGRVRALVDYKGAQVKEAGPSFPVEVLGLGGVPMAGDQLTVVENEQRAREVAQYRQEQATAKRTALAPTNFDTMFSNMKSDVVEFPVLVKADVQGSVEAITTALHNLSNEDIKVRVLHAGVGAITETDVSLAAASKAPIIGFNVRPNAKARVMVEREKVRMMYHDVIYHLTDEITREMIGELGPLKVENVHGPRRGQAGVPCGQARQGRRSAGGRRRHPQGLPRPSYTTGRHRVGDGHPVAAPVQGRCGRGPRRSGMRRGAGRYERHQAGRPARSVRDRGARADVVSGGALRGILLRPQCQRQPAEDGGLARSIEAGRVRECGNSGCHRQRPVFA